MTGVQPVPSALPGLSARGWLLLNVLSSVVGGLAAVALFFAYEFVQKAGRHPRYAELIIALWVAIALVWLATWAGLFVRARAEKKAGYTTTADGSPMLPVLDSRTGTVLARGGGMPIPDSPLRSLDPVNVNPRPTATRAVAMAAATFGVFTVALVFALLYSSSVANSPEGWSPVLLLVPLGYGMLIFVALASVALSRSRALQRLSERYPDDLEFLATRGPGLVTGLARLGLIATAGEGGPSLGGRVGAVANAEGIRMFRARSTEPSAFVPWNRVTGLTIGNQPAGRSPLRTIIVSAENSGHSAQLMLTSARDSMSPFRSNAQTDWLARELLALWTESRH